MRILLINTFYYPNVIGGTENSVKILCEKLVDNGHQVVVYTVDRDTNNKAHEESNGVKVYRYKVSCFKKNFTAGDLGYKILQVHMSDFMHGTVHRKILKNYGYLV